MFSQTKNVIEIGVCDNPRNPNDQQIQPPFPENYVDGEGEAEPIEDQIHHFGDLDSDIYLIEIEHNVFSRG